MINFEVFFIYNSKAYRAVISRQYQIPDIIAIREPNNLHLPSVFTLNSTKLNGSPIMGNHPGLGDKIATAVDRYCITN